MITTTDNPDSGADLLDAAYQQLEFDQGSLLSAAMVFGLVFAWPGCIPLTRALERLHPVSRPATYACAPGLCPLSVGAATIGGLFGPPGIWIYAGIVSLPAWLVLWLLRWRARRLAALGGSEQGEAVNVSL